MKTDRSNYAHGGNIYDIKRRYKKNVIDFSASINPLGLPVKVKNILNASLNSLCHYPDPDAHDLKSKISEHLGLKTENILMGNGSVELIYLIFNTFRPCSTTLPIPSFTEYERAAKSVKSKIDFIQLKESNGFNLDPGSICASDMIFICNPNNPTANFIIDNSSNIEKIPNKLIVVDEVFIDFAQEQRKRTLIKRAEKSRKIIVLRSFTKFFALPGLRVGYLIAHKDNINKLKQHQVPWSVNSLAQKAAESMLSDRSYMQRTRKIIKKERQFLSNEINAIKGLKPYDAEANFILIKIENKKLTSGLVKEKLLEDGILIRDCANFRGLNERFIRVAVRSHSENLKLIRMLKEVV